ncbi:MAG TPA: DUF4013 domain-containing protein [Vicinamibacteria bacterium]|nr:DUF4013 domain-containing protein [Vicinamibacteria bacterium]
MASPTQPAAASGTFDFGRAFTFIKEDPDAVKKVLIGSAFGLLGILVVGAIFLLGYQMRLIQRVARGESRPLPEWDDFGGLFVDGLKLIVVNIVYALGLLLILGCPFGVLLLGFSAAAGGKGSHGGLEALGVLGVMAFYGAILLASLLLFVYLPSALVRLAITNDFAAGFQVKENIGFIRRNPLNYLLSLVLQLVGNFIAQFGILLCCVGVFPAGFWAMCMAGWALGETARRDPVLCPAQKY